MSVDPIQLSDSVQMDLSPPKSTKKIKKMRQNKLSLITPPDLSLFAICWVKVRGFKDWPGVIESRNDKGQYIIHFFGDYTTTTVTKSKITNFFKGFSLFNKTFDAPLLKKAITEACICLTKNISPSSCVVCDIISYKELRKI